MHRSFLVMVALLLALTAAACSAVTPVATPTASSTPQPVASATPVPEPTATTPAATATSAATVEGSGTDADVVIVLRRSGGIAGRHDVWTIYGDGRVVDGEGVEKRVDAAAVAAVVAQAEAADFFAQDVSVPKMSGCADCFTYELAISRAGEEHRIAFQDAQEDVPQSMLDLMAAVKALVDAAK